MSKLPESLDSFEILEKKLAPLHYLYVWATRPVTKAEATGEHVGQLPFRKNFTRLHRVLSGFRVFVHLKSQISHYCPNLMD
jgi:hypothetical protein